jgi:hypothetical protein
MERSAPSRTAIEERLARLSRAVARAAAEEESEARQTALEGLARFACELAAHFEAEESRAASPFRHREHARLRGDLAEIDERARAAGDWPESWRAIAAAFARFAAKLEEHERAEAGQRRETRLEAKERT